MSFISPTHTPSFVPAPTPQTYQSSPGSNSKKKSRCIFFHSLITPCKKTKQKESSITLHSQSLHYCPLLHHFPQLGHASLLHHHTGTPVPTNSNTTAVCNGLPNTLRLTKKRLTQQNTIGVTIHVRYGRSNPGSLTRNTTRPNTVTK